MLAKSSYPIPDSALDDRLAFIGTSGAGKTYSAGTAVEKLLASGAKVVVVDPLGVWWGLRLNADGKARGFDLPIFGGEHGDIALNEGAGKLIGETVASMRESCIVDLSGLGTKASERRFMLAFLENLYRTANGSTFHVVFDEADLWAPQKSSEPMLQSRMEEIVRRGRVKGFIPWLITQRPAVLSKDVLSQADGLVAFKLTASQDRKAIGDWVKATADEGQWPTIDAALPGMERGQGVVWLPSRGILETTQFPAKATFDSSRTPKRGEKREVRDLKPLNLDSLKGKLAAIEDEQKANDPRALKDEIRRLNNALAKELRTKSTPAKPEIVHANADEIEAAREEGRASGYAAGVRAAADAISALGGKPSRRHRPSPPPAADFADRRSTSQASQAAIATQGVTGPQQRILDAIAWWSAFGIEQPMNEQVAFMSGYSPTSGGYKNPKSAAKVAGLIDYPRPGLLCLTDAGREKAAAFLTPTTRDELHRRVNERLSGPQRAILAPLLNAWPEEIANDDLAAAAGYSPTSGGYKNPKSSLRTLGVVDYPSPGQVRAADWLFP